MKKRYIEKGSACFFLFFASQKKKARVFFCEGMTHQSAHCLVFVFCFLFLNGKGADVFTATDFINTFNKAAASSVVNTIIDLRADLDFSQTNLFLPLGSQSPSGCIPFGGVLHGNGHSIKGLVMENTITENSPNAGLFLQSEKCHD